MVSSGLHHLPIEYISVYNTVPLALVILGFVPVFLYMILDWDNKIYSFFLGFKSSAFQGHVKYSKVGDEKNKDSELVSINKQPGFKAKKHGESICREDVEVVFKSLGLFSHPAESAKLDHERLDCNDLSNLFDETQATEDEVKAAFDVFDENKDGFIDAKELQRLLCALGFREGTQLKNCRRMIRMFDENGDERIDFREFVKSMEGSFC